MRLITSINGTLSCKVDAMREEGICSKCAPFGLIALLEKKLYGSGDVALGGTSLPGCPALGHNLIVSFVIQYYLFIVRVVSNLRISAPPDLPEPDADIYGLVVGLHFFLFCGVRFIAYILV